MGTSGGPNVNRSGLVLYLDAPTKRSFRGQSTENLAPSGQRTCSSHFTRKSGHRETWSYALETNVLGRKHATKIYINPTGNTAQPYADWGFTAHKSGGSEVGDVYAISFDYRVTKGSNTPRITIAYANGYKSPTSSNVGTFGTQVYQSLPDGWTRYKRTITINTAGNTFWRFACDSDNEDTEIYVDNFQVELGDKITRFVDGTRGTTVATGGGWRDISGNNNHGEILNGVTTDNDGDIDGALDFDGTDDVVELPTSIASIGTVGSIEAIFKADTNHRGAILGWGNLDTTHWGTFEIGPSTGTYSDEYISYVNRKNSSGYNLVFMGRDSTAGSYKLNDGNFHHVVVVVDGSDNCFYVDGTKITPSFPDGLSTTSAFIDVDSIQKIRVGDSTYNGGHIPFNGKIPLIRIYDRGLTSGEVIRNYKSLKKRYGI
jgi:hypothetical protein